jgi:hypothetical protein
MLRIIINYYRIMNVNELQNWIILIKISQLSLVKIEEMNENFVFCFKDHLEILEEYAEYRNSNSKLQI